MGRLVALLTDLTERQRLEEELRQLAFQDALTLLPNRRLLIDRLDQAMKDKATLAARMTPAQIAEAERRAMAWQPGP